MTCPAGDVRIDYGQQGAIPAGGLGLAKFYERQVCTDAFALAYEAPQNHGSTPEPQGYCESAAGLGDWAPDTGSYVCLTIYSTPDGAPVDTLTAADGAAMAWAVAAVWVISGVARFLKGAAT